ncbi:hypothetical protein WOLCODRAFT_148603 [Wolfiporia cocos MD-104 SS10]|uniref:C2H2-type domain-containing protein n=1 Tax=Wolfiporia cocos (strain MD-104) TaxID=742152 RepID=A0A2H3JLZ1_WOLCO|nr:hypothetical protein WOLCODRAFT_148603 [Wolfiporia cocos MD-104 SS10]
MQVHISTDEFQTMLKAALETLRCPLDGCDYVQEPPLRSQDMRRHLESHRSNKNRQKWVCCGVPREHMAVYGVTVPYNTITFKGIEMVNGCLRTFSRRDALVRHIKTQNNQCLAEEGFWHLLHAPEPPDSSASAM